MSKQVLKQCPEGFKWTKDQTRVGMNTPYDKYPLAGVMLHPPPKVPGVTCGISVMMHPEFIALVPLTREQVRQLADALYQILAEQ